MTRAFNKDLKRIQRDPESFWKYVLPVTESGCWLWLASGPDGYGRFGTQGAHRLSYVLAKGPIPRNLQIDHLCRVRCCVNPHEAVTAKENNRRARRDKAFRAEPIDRNFTCFYFQIPEELKRRLERHLEHTGVRRTFFVTKAFEEKLSREVAA